MKHDFSDFVTELPITPAIAAVLQENNVHTMEDLKWALYNHSLGSLLDTEQHVELIKAVWTWIMRPYQNPA